MAVALLNRFSVISISIWCTWQILLMFMCLYVCVFDMASGFIRRIDIIESNVLSNVVFANRLNRMRIGMTFAISKTNWNRNSNRTPVTNTDHTLITISNENLQTYCNQLPIKRNPGKEWNHEVHRSMLWWQSLKWFRIKIIVCMQYQWWVVQVLVSTQFDCYHAVSNLITFFVWMLSNIEMEREEE